MLYSLQHKAMTTLSSNGQREAKGQKQSLGNGGEAFGNEEKEQSKTEKSESEQGSIF